jgi:hypothetical protein
VDQGFPSSPDRLPLSYAFGCASRLSVARSGQFRNTTLTHSIHRKSVSERETYKAIITHLDKQIVGWDHRAYCYFYVLGMKA